MARFRARVWTTTVVNIHDISSSNYTPAEVVGVDCWVCIAEFLKNITRKCNGIMMVLLEIALQLVRRTRRRQIGSWFHCRCRPEPQLREKIASIEVFPLYPPSFADFLDTSETSQTAVFQLLQLV